MDWINLSIQLQTMQQDKRPFKTWVEISEKALIYNLAFFKKRVGAKTKILCVLKSNAYGHGLKEVAKILKDEKNAEWFGVDNLKEALVLKNLGIKKPILILGYTRFTDLRKTIQNAFSFVVYNKETLLKIISLKLKKPAKLHLKIETGLNRQGIEKKNLLKFLQLIRKHGDRLILEGVYTHLADPDDREFSLRQIADFEKVVHEAKKFLDSDFITHCVATAGAFCFGNLGFDAVRIGIGLYGLWPSDKIQNKFLKPVLTWKSLVSQVKVINKGESVGYGRTWFSKKETRIAVIPVGYADGFARSLSNIGRVLINGVSCPVLGRVMMNMIVVDITNVRNIKPEDEVVLIGKDGREYVGADEIAKKLSTINHEVLVGINQTLPRVII